MVSDFPRAFTDGVIHWQVTVRQPTHFRAVARLAPEKADADAIGSAGCGLLLVLGGTFLALGAGWMGLEAVSRILRFGPHPVALREALTFLAIFLGWFALLYVLAPKVWVLVWCI